MLPIALDAAARTTRRRRVSTPVQSWMRFSPLSLRPTVWLDAADTSTITASSGLVSQWNDKSGNGFHVLQATASAQPTTGTTTQNGLNVLSLDGGDFMDSVENIPISGASRRSMFAVAKTTGTGWRALFSWGSPALKQACSFAVVSGTTEFAVGYFADLQGDLRSGNTMGTTSMRVMGCTFDGGTTYGRFNGANTSTATGTITGLNTTSTKFTLGRQVNNAENWLGTIAEVLVFPSVLSAQEIGLLEAYFNAKWAVY